MSCVGDFTFRLGQPRWHHLQIGSTKVTSASDWDNQGGITFRLGQPRWRQPQIWSTKVMSPSDWVNQGYVSLRLGQPRWRHLQIGSTKVTSPSDRVNQGDVNQMWTKLIEYQASFDDLLNLWSFYSITALQYGKYSNFVFRLKICPKTFWGAPWAEKMMLSFKFACFCFFHLICR